LFPPGTGGPRPDDDHVAKPATWAIGTKFLDAQKISRWQDRCAPMAVSGGDKAAHAQHNPDREIGIGRWRFADFERALRWGIAPETRTICRFFRSLL
jgi:hypothetical protein